MLTKVMERLDKIEPLLDACNDEELKICAGFLADRITNPDSYVTFLGETSSGKSTLINGLIGAPELIMRARPSTGAITEVELCDGNVREYYAINKDASIETIDRATFLRLTETPDKMLQRLKLKIGTGNNQYHHMRIFDTPGYGSIVAEHEEILKEFLPNSDVVVYTVRYNIGVQENDYCFLRFLHELIREDAEMILVINCCPVSVVPEHDNRIREIKKYVSDILGVSPHTFVIKREACKNEDDYPLPRAHDMWNYISGIVNGEAHQAVLEHAFNEYVTDLYKKCDAIISSRYIQAQLADEDIKAMNAIGHETAEKLREAIPKLIEPAFEKIERNLPGKFDQAAESAKKQIFEEIENSHSIDKDQQIAYIQSHLLPFAISKYSLDIQDYIGVILEQLNKELDDYINKIITDYQLHIQLKLNNHVEAAVKNSASKLVERVGTQLLKQVFTKFGGAGGANAGVANAASHLLKELGNMFGKTFSRETHNALKHFLARIGATSMRAISIGITVFAEAVMMIIDYATWKGKLKKAVANGVDKWKETTLPSAVDDIRECRQRNINMVAQIADSFENDLNNSEKPQSDQLLELVKMSKEIGKSIGIVED